MDLFAGLVVFVVAGTADGLRRRVRKTRIEI